MKFLKNRKTATGITALIILFSILLGAHLSLTKLKEETLSVFYHGENTGEKGIQSDLEYISDQCYNLTVVAGRYMNREEETVKEVSEHLEALKKAAAPGDKYKAKENLIKASMELHEKLVLMNLTEKDRYYCDSFPVNLRSRELIISHSSYNEKAASYNRCLQRFPANILSRITFVRPLELYE